jgi:hypothetical protein
MRNHARLACSPPLLTCSQAFEELAAEAEAAAETEAEAAEAEAEAAAAAAEAEAAEEATGGGDETSAKEME